MQPRSSEIPLAVVGLGCRMPGADNLDEYWRLVRDGKSGIVKLPESRLDRNLYFDPEKGKVGKSYSEIGGVVPERPINRDICPLPNEILENYDSVHLIMCEVAAMACRHAGYDPFHLPQRNVGVYIGHSGGSCLSGDFATATYLEEVTHHLANNPAYRSLPPEVQQVALRNIVEKFRSEKPRRKADGNPDLSTSMVSGVIAHAFGLQGPYLAIDAACASSLIAMATGAHALRQGYVDMALVGGASFSKWYGLVLFSMAQSISNTGSRPFDANADGLVSSDGYAVVVLKTLPKALADGDKIHAVIRGVGMSSDGRGKSLWAPRKEGQIHAINRAYGPEINPVDLQYIECHATSTQVGDATELGALTMALKDKLPEGRKLPIGSVKANIGHTLESAGIAGFVKAVLCLQNRILPGQINFQTPNPDVDWANIPFEVNRQSRPWPEPENGKPRRAAVNAFGIGGLNVHVVIDDAPSPEMKKQFSVPVKLPARSAVTVQEHDDNSVAIIGRAAILPGALTLDAYWDLLVSGRDPKTEAPADRWNKNIFVDPKSDSPWRFKTSLGGFVNDFVYDWKKHKVPPKQIDNANPLQFMLLDGADQALREAGYDKKPFDRTKTAVVVGSAFGGDFACQLQMGLRVPEFQQYLRTELKSRGVPADKIEAIAEAYQTMLLKQMPALLDETGSFTASTLASRLTKTFDLMGGALAMDAGDVSSMAALYLSMGLLLNGAAETVLCAAGQRNMDLNIYEIFTAKGMITGKTPKPLYAADADGVVPAEGVGVVLLKRLADARRDGDPIYGIIRSMGAAGHCGDFRTNFRTAAARAFEQSGIDPAQVTVFESARAGKKDVDAGEVEMAADIFGADNRGEPLVMSSVSGQIGHALGTSGMASLLKSTLEMQHGQVPKNAGLDQTIPAVKQHADSVQVADQPRKLYATLPNGKTVADVVNSASTGLCYHLLVEGGENLPAMPQKAKPVSQPVAKNLRTIRLAAPTRDVLVKELARLQQNAEILFQTGGQDHFNGQDNVRIAVLAEDTAALTKKLRLASEMIHKPGARLALEQQGVFLQDAGKQQPRIAFLFPGQGSQYAGMLKELVAEVPAAAEKVREINAVLARLGLGRFEDICWANAEKLGNDVWTTQLSVLLADVVMHHVLLSIGLRPDVISAHSYGEFPALVAAGVLTLEDAIRATQVRTSAVEGHDSTRGALLSTTAPLDAAERMMTQLRGGVYLASHNAPDQTVIGGTTDAITGLKKLLESEGYGCKILAVPRPYHTPLLQAAREPFRASLANIAFQRPQVKFLSSVTNNYAGSGEEVRNNLVEQLTTPVRYVDQIRKLMSEGVSIFIEVGPHHVLTRLNQRILAEQAVSAISADQPSQPGLAALNRVKTLLETAGVVLGQPKAAPAAAGTNGKSRILYFDATTGRKVEDRGAKVEERKETPAPVVAVAQPTTGLNRDELTPFVINFVVDQTGYPAEMVELDADLEADLGIDSIKKAQLIGELAENYDLKHLSGNLQNLSLDDFRTIRSILDFVCQGASEGGSAKAEGGREERKEVAADAEPSTLNSQPSTTLNRDELTPFVINFVVDQTGYPAEMVELDADLEADLGIDSIKKAQLIGELAENYDLKHLSGNLQNLSLDDFRTIRSILDFVCQGASEGGSAKAEGGREEREEVALPVAAVAEPSTLNSQPSTTLNRDELTPFVINFVVDQTGYPAEMVELDADLEADLGIDSIKKAQLIGELAENYDLKHLSGNLQNLSLDDFRTIRSILDFVCQGAGEGGSAKVEGGREEREEVVTSVAAVAQPSSGLNRDELTPFVINFVVDQTGYPAEMVELDADLEADLGIDSIKKAQLIGELAENYDLKHLSGNLQNLSLDDFRTIRSILDFVCQGAGEGGSAKAEGGSEERKEVAAVAEPSTLNSQPSTTLNRDELTPFVINFVVDQTGYPAEMVELDADLEADLGIDSIKKAQLIGELAENYDLKHLSGNLQNLSLDDFRTIRSILDFVCQGSSEAGSVQQVEVAVPVAAAAEPSTLNAQPSTTLNRDELTPFVINFVVDQTGYPAEMVELDADLEADLGIDSIKKAQLIGELAENYDLKHLSGNLQNLSLDDFRTIRSILDFVCQGASEGGSAKAEGGSEERKEVAAVAEPSTLNSQPSTTLNRDELTPFVINFVVDQTGYPAEMVELDADLEADLGIDSIKKAQLIGELAENYDLKHLSGNLQNLSLDDFRTIRSILDFVCQGGSQGGVEEQVAVVASVSQPSALNAQPAQPAVATMESRILALDINWPTGFNVVQGHGSPYEIGKQHGSDQADQIRTIMERYASMLGPRLQNIPELDEALAKPTLYFGEDDLEELNGIADGSNLPVAAVIAHNLGMYPDYIPGCTQFAVTAKCNSQIGLVHAVNEDSPLSLTLPDCLSRVVQVRIPRGRIPHVTFSVSGQAGGLNGMNAMGIAVSSTLLLDRPRRPGTTTGKVHPVIVKRVLERASTIEEAVEIVRTMDRVGAWSLCISHFPTDRLCYLEYDGKSLAVQENPPFVLTTNHCLIQPPVADVPEHSMHRLNRLHQLLGEKPDGQWTLERSQKALRDQFDLARGRKTTHATMNTVRRVDNQISVVMLPGTGELWITPGPRAGERQDEYFRFNLRELFQTAIEGDRTGDLAPEKIVLNTVSLREGLPAESDFVVHRHVMAAVPVKLPNGTPETPKFHGPALLLGNCKAGEALKARLQQLGATVHQLPDGSDVDAAVAEVNRLWAIAPAPHLFVATACEDAAVITEDQFPARALRGMQVPYFVCQRWAQLVQEAGLTPKATLVGLTALGGDFGFSGRIAGVEGGGITGLFKGIRREMPGTLVKVIDAPLEENPAQLAANTLKEMAAATVQLEVGYLRGERYLPKAIPQPASTQRTADVVPHGTWVVTGGARGVTAVVARELGKRFGLSMHLLGSTQLPNIDPTWRNLTDEGMKALKRTISEQARAAGRTPAQVWKEVERAIEIDRTLQAFRADGVKVVYHACDVSDRASLAKTIDQIRKLDGAINGVIHGAGFEAACKFDRKKRDNVKMTFGVKVDAAMSLIELTKDEPLGWFVGFGSTSGRFGGLGQTDYSMSSDMLCKICDWLRVRRPDVASVGFHWPPWAEVGMAARPESKIALESSGMAFMPPLEGVAHVLNELTTQMLEGEILCLDKPDKIDTDETMCLSAGMDAYRQRNDAIRSAAVIDGVIDLQAPRQLTAIARFNPQVEPFLLEHRHQGIPILPAVVGMESMAEASNILTAGGQKVVAIKDMTIHQGFRFHTDRTQTAQVVAQQAGQGIHCELRADFCDRQGRLVEPRRLQMDATLELADHYVSLPLPKLGPEPTAWTKHKYFADWRTMKFPEDGRVYHGYPFQGLQEYAIVEGGLWAKIIVPQTADVAGERNVDGWLLPSTTIDAGLLASDLYVWNHLHVAQLPQKFDRIRMARALKDGEPLTLRMWLKSRVDRDIVADIVLVDANGQVVIQIDGYHMVEVKSGTGTGGDVAAPAPVAPTPAVKTAPIAAKPVSAVKTVSAADIAALPLIDSAQWVSDGELQAELMFDPVKDVFLAQHKFNGQPILPAVTGLESMIEAASLALPGKYFGGLKEFVISNGLRFKTEAPQAARVKVVVENGLARCQLLGGDDLSTLQQTALIKMVDQPQVLTAPAVGQPPFPYNPMMYPDDAQLVHGKAFRALKQLFLHRDGGWSQIAGYPISNMAGQRKGDRWFLPMAVLDSCFVACAVDMFIQLEKRVEVPYSCEEFQFGRLPKPNEQCTLRMLYRGHDERHTKYDFTLYGADHSVIFTMKAYQGIVTGRDGDASLWDGKANIA